MGGRSSSSSTFLIKMLCIHMVTRVRLVHMQLCWLEHRLSLIRTSIISIPIIFATMGFSKPAFQKFSSLYNAAVAADDTRLVQIKDQMLKLLVDNEEARVKFVYPKAMVPHPKNRGGSRMQWSKIYEKGAKIISVGVSLLECGPDKAIAFEEDQRTRHMAHRHIELCKTSPYYARYEDPDQVEAGSVGCGHWNQMLACILDRRPVPEKFRAKLCEPGKANLDPDRLSRDQPALKQLLENGLKTTVIKK